MDSLSGGYTDLRLLVDIEPPEYEYARQRSVSQSKILTSILTKGFSEYTVWVLAQLKELCSSNHNQSSIVVGFAVGLVLATLRFWQKDDYLPR